SALEAPCELIHNKIFNVGKTEENFRIREIAELVRETVPDSEIRHAKDAEPDKRSYRVDFSKIGHALSGFRPQWTARLGAKQLYEAFKEFALSLEESEGSKYQRITHLEELVRSGVLDKTLRRMNYTRTPKYESRDKQTPIS
ncbi:MAG: NAD-dependent dehydratase, partial [Candidatus Bathyarchaeia archaeon]